MSNPFQTGQFTCCQCPGDEDPPKKYLHRCGCPNVHMSYAGESRVAYMCGWREAVGHVSTPPKFYKVLTISQGARSVGTSYFHSSSDCAGEPRTQYTYSGTSIFDRRVAENGCDPFTLNSIPTTSGGRTLLYEEWGCGQWVDGVFVPGHFGPASQLYDINTSASRSLQFNTNAVGSELVGDTVTSATSMHQVLSSHGTGVAAYYDVHFVLSVEDKEDNAEDSDDFDADSGPGAIQRATPTDLTSKNTSIYELRTTSNSFHHRTVSYTAKASGIVPGVTYSGCLRIRRREAYSGTVPEGANTEWEEVEPQIFEAFTFAPDEDGFTEIETGDLPHARGWEYDVMDVAIWPINSPCDCPTEYEPEAE